MNFCCHGACFGKIKPEETGKMTGKKEKKDYCDAGDQQKIVEKMTECDKTSTSDKQVNECYSKVIEEDDGCMSS